jgi:hypothetical protein
MVGNSSGIRGTEYMLLKGGYLLRCGVHYYDFPDYDVTEVIHRGFPKPRLHLNDWLSGIKIDSKGGWTEADVANLGFRRNAEQVEPRNRH